MTAVNPPAENDLMRDVMGRFATGVTIIAAATEDGVHGMTANAFMSGSLEPPLCLISVARDARMHSYLERAGSFSVNMLAHDQEAFSQHFAGKPIEGLDVPFDRVRETPVLVGAMASVAADIAAAHDCGDHTLFVGRVFHLSARDAEPLLFFSGRYGTFQQRPAGYTIPDPNFL